MNKDHDHLIVTTPRTLDQVRKAAESHNTIDRPMADYSHAPVTETMRQSLQAQMAWEEGQTYDSAVGTVTDYGTTPEVEIPDTMYKYSRRERRAFERAQAKAAKKKGRRR